jgi:hypothetical protein
MSVLLICYGVSGDERPFDRHCLADARRILPLCEDSSNNAWHLQETRATQPAAQSRQCSSLHGALQETAPLGWSQRGFSAGLENELSRSRGIPGSVGVSIGSTGRLVGGRRAAKGSQQNSRTFTRNFVGHEEIKLAGICVPISTLRRGAARDADDRRGARVEWCILVSVQVAWIGHRVASLHQDTFS